MTDDSQRYKDSVTEVNLTEEQAPEQAFDLTWAGVNEDQRESQFGLLPQFEGYSTISVSKF